MNEEEQNFKKTSEILRTNKPLRMTLRTLLGIEKNTLNLGVDDDYYIGGVGKTFKNNKKYVYTEEIIVPKNCHLFIQPNFVLNSDLYNIFRYNNICNKILVNDNNEIQPISDVPYFDVNFSASKLCKLLITNKTTKTTLNAANENSTDIQIGYCNNYFLPFIKYPGKTTTNYGRKLKEQLNDTIVDSAFFDNSANKKIIYRYEPSQNSDYEQLGECNKKTPLPDTNVELHDIFISNTDEIVNLADNNEALSYQQNLILYYALRMMDIANNLTERSLIYKPTGDSTNAVIFIHNNSNQPVSLRVSYHFYLRIGKDEEYIMSEDENNILNATYAIADVIKKNDLDDIVNQKTQLQSIGDLLSGIAKVGIGLLNKTGILGNITGFISNLLQ
jgi:hypothetical protein